MLKWLRPAGSQVGLDIGSYALKGVHLESRRGRKTVKGWGVEVLPPGVVQGGTVIDPLLLGEAIASLLKRLQVKNPRVVASVPGRQVFLRRLDFPAVKRITEAELRQAVYLHLEGILPFPAEEAVADFLIPESWQPGQETLEVLVAAVRRRLAEQIVEAFKIAGTTLEALEAEPLALGRCLAYCCGKTQRKAGVNVQEGLQGGAVAVVNMGHETTQCSFFAGGVLRFSRTVNTAGWEKENIGEEIRRSFEYYLLQHPEEPVRELKLTGGKAADAGWESFLAERLSLPVSRLELLPGRAGEGENKACFPAEGEEEALRWTGAVALGLAARGLGRL